MFWTTLKLVLTQIRFLIKPLLNVGLVKLRFGVFTPPTLERYKSEDFKENRFKISKVTFPEFTDSNLCKDLNFQKYDYI